MTASLAGGLVWVVIQSIDPVEENIIAKTFRVLSTDNYKSANASHATQVEPDSFSWESTIVMAVQTGRYYDGGCDNICWTTSKDGGISFPYKGCLPGLTFIAGGNYSRASDPSVAYDLKHNVWLISALALSLVPFKYGAAVATSQSFDGGITWQPPTFAAIVNTTSNLDKNWIVCDNTNTSIYFGHCYVQYDDFGARNLLLMTTSNNGGTNWTDPKPLANRSTGFGGQPLVLPNGTVIVIACDASCDNMISYFSKTGGNSWSNSFQLSTLGSRDGLGNMRGPPFPSCEIAMDGRIFCVWTTCDLRYLPCLANDLIYITSPDGENWSEKKLLPLPNKTGRTYFIPGLAVDRTTQGNTTLLGLTYYYADNCTDQSPFSSCELNVGFISSRNAALNWTQPIILAGPFSSLDIAQTSAGAMVGDYISTSFNQKHQAVPSFSIALAKKNLNVYQQPLCTSFLPIDV